MSVDLKWPRSGVWPPVRGFDREAALAAMQAVTTVAEVQTRNLDLATRTTIVGTQTFHTPAPVWSSLITQPELGRDEAWFYYTILWKRDASSIADATAEPVPVDPLARVRHDLAERAAPGWWDARTFWCCVAGMLSRAELAALVGDARIFAHSYREGGTSILTSHAQRISFVPSISSSCLGSPVPSGTSSVRPWGGSGPPSSTS